MKIRGIAALLEAEPLCCENALDVEILDACASDMMSDVLALVKNETALLTGLVNPQVVRTAMMVDMRCIVFVRGKHPNDEMLALAEENHIVLLTTQLAMFDACGRLYANLQLRGG